MEVDTNLISVGSLFVAVCALVFTAWQLSVQRRHNKISVRPHLFVFTQRSQNNDVYTLQILLINNGLGPAFIDSFQLFHRGREVQPKVVLSEVLGDMMKNSSHTTLGNDYAMPPNEKKVLLSVTFQASSENKVQSLEEKINEIDLVICYSSVYEAMEPYDSRENS